MHASSPPILEAVLISFQCFNVCAVEKREGEEISRETEMRSYGLRVCSELTARRFEALREDSNSSSLTALPVEDLQVHIVVEHSSLSMILPWFPITFYREMRRGFLLLLLFGMVNPLPKAFVTMLALNLLIQH